MEQLVLHPSRLVDGEVTIPGSKSLSNRILLLAALAEGETSIVNLLSSDDINHMLGAFKKLGITAELGNTCTVQGGGGPVSVSEPVELFLGNAGTAMRPLAAALCLGQGEFILDGEPRMRERPIGDLVEALRPLGANIEYLGDEGYPPLKIKANGLKGGKTSVKGGISSQFLTALLMAAPYAENDIEITVEGELVSKPYIDITTHVMKTFGVEVVNNNYQSFVVKAGQKYCAPEKEVFVEGDASSASYFLAAGAIAGGTVKVHGCGTESVQGDAKFADVLEAMGAKITWGPTWIQVEKGDLTAVDMDMNHIPDAAMTIATTALFAKGTTVIRNIYNWRVKETDRLYAMATELRKLGATVVEGEDFIEVTPPDKLTPAAIDTYDDHRIAMCFSLASLNKGWYDVDITINDPKVTSKTFPTYFDELAKLIKE
ncbi:MAG: 3-phosphoshikimate 1-carboxyvinyltransferase [Fibrobacterales bacterium]